MPSLPFCVCNPRWGTHSLSQIQASAEEDWYRYCQIFKDAGDERQTRRKLCWTCKVYFSAEYMWLWYWRPFPPYPYSKGRLERMVSWHVVALYGNLLFICFWYSLVLSSLPLIDFVSKLRWSGKTEKNMKSLSRKASNLGLTGCRQRKVWKHPDKLVTIEKADEAWNVF